VETWKNSRESSKEGVRIWENCCSYRKSQSRRVHSEGVLGGRESSKKEEGAHAKKKPCSGFYPREYAIGRRTPGGAERGNLQKKTTGIKKREE